MYKMLGLMKSLAQRFADYMDASMLRIAQKPTKIQQPIAKQL